MKEWRTWLCRAVGVALFFYALPTFFDLPNWDGFLRMKIVSSVAMSALLAGVTSTVFGLVIGAERVWTTKDSR